MKPILSQKEYAIEINHVSKDFEVYFDKGYSLKERLLFWQRNRSEMRHVLKDIDIKVEKGECVGLIGQNGAGKSTMLKLLSKIIYPNKGEVITRGRVACLIELGAGFHPDMSGRENIYTNASIFGLTKKEIDQRVDDIIAFSELEEFIDNPVRTYSSGMYMRLAFSVAINVDADILLVDEILAVGDAAFQAKCFNKMREIKASGVTIVIVSHNLGQIEQLCDRSVWFKDGIIEKEGMPIEVHPYYLDYMGSKDTGNSKNIKTDNSNTNEDNKTDNSNTNEDNKTEFRWGSREGEIVRVELLDKNDNQKTLFKTGEPMTIVIHYISNGMVSDAIVGIGFFRNDGLQCYGVNTSIDRYGNIVLKNKGKIRCLIHNISLLEGQYWLDVAIIRQDNFCYDYWKRCLKFGVYSETKDIGVFRLSHEWERG